MYLEGLRLSFRRRYSLQPFLRGEGSLSYQRRQVGFFPLPTSQKTEGILTRVYAL